MAGAFALPAGTVTLLIAVVDTSGPDVTVALGELVEHAVAEHDGIPWPDREVAGRMIGVFAKASDAVAAALATRRAVLDKAGSRVRIAVHSGEARLQRRHDGVRSDDIGPVLLAASRLSACAHGGQVLVAGATADLAADAMPDGAVLVDLGVLRLARRERVFQLAHDGLPSDFPPLRSLDTVPNSLPTPLTSLLGRYAELLALPAELAAHRCVTLTGAGGVGKTRLAQQLAADLIARHPGGTWWAELASSATPAAVLAAVAEAMQLRLHQAPEPQRQLVAHLARGEPTLIVFDNCEHVIDTVAELVHRLLIDCPSVSVLSTSRERLGVPGERVWRVASLAAPSGDELVTLARLDAFDAVALFIERARQVRPNLVVDERAAPHIAAICARLDGIPLAIELAAARARSLPVERLAYGLDDVFGLLTGGPRVVVPRQQTLLASIAWSYDLLVENDRAVLRRLSICPTWFDVDAAESVAAGGDVGSMDVLDCLTRLVDKNLLEYDDGGRYRMLETIRQFASVRLTEAGEEEAARRRYADHWAALTLVIGGDSGRYDPYAVLAAITDITAMLDWAMQEDAELADRVLAGAAPGLFGLSRWPELQRACDWVAADRPHGPSWAAAVAAVSMGASMMGRLDVLRLTDEALRVAEAANDIKASLHLRVGPSYVCMSNGDLSMVRALVIDAIAAGENYPAFAAATGLTECLAYLGQCEELGAAYRAALSTKAEAFDLLDSAAGPARAVGDHLAGELDAAIEGLPATRPAWELMTRMWAEMAARVAVDRDDVALAERALSMMNDEEAAGSAVHRELAVWGHRVTAADVVGAVASAEVAGAEAQTPFQRIHATCMLAATLADLERWDDARAALRRVDDALAAVSEPAPRPRATAAVTRTAVALAAGRLGEADDAAHRALRLAGTAGLRLIQVDALEAVAAVALAGGDPTKAARLLAATSAERGRRGYYGRFTSPVTAPTVGRLAGEHPAAWSEGARLTLDEATELARRRRGPRGRPRFGIDALTPTEQLVVGLVSRGHTNAEIAGELLIAVPTVKTHLTRTYAKLGVRNRAELVALVTRRPPLG